tara:strand:- start:59 stop:388 length:330 start_codon:yes stop_codon:yes gene_type:complete
MESALTQEEFNNTYEIMFDLERDTWKEIDKYNANSMFKHMQNFDQVLLKFDVDELNASLSYFENCPILRIRRDFADKNFIEFTPQQMELFKVEALGLIEWYIKGREELL